MMLNSVLTALKGDINATNSDTVMQYFNLL